MSALLNVRAALVAGMKADARLAGVHIDTHGGEFKPADLERYSKQAPTVVVALLAAPLIDMFNHQVRASWIMIAICNDLKGLKRDAGAIALVDKVIRVASPLFVSNETASRLENLDARNLFGEAIDKAGVSMWAITAQQRIELRDDQDGLVDFTGFNATWVEPSTADPGVNPDPEELIELEVDNLDA